jgi:hypothetical protein
MTKSAPEAMKKRCVVCDNEIPRNEKKECPVCSCKPDGKECTNCKRWIPLGASFCSRCMLYGGLRRHFNMAATALSLVIALFAVIRGFYLTGAYLSDRNSHTRFKVTGSDQSHVYLRIWNTGRKPSALLSYRLKFADLPAAKELTLQQFNEDEKKATNLIVPGKDPVSIALGLPLREELPAAQQSKQYTSDELRTLRQKPLNEISVILEIDVEESDDEGTSQPRRDQFKADRINKLIGRLTQ